MATFPGIVVPTFPAFTSGSEFGVTTICKVANVQAAVGNA